MIFLYNSSNVGHTHLHYIKEGCLIKMDESKLAELDLEQLQEISKLELKIGVTLIAYDSMTTLNNDSNETPMV